MIALKDGLPCLQFESGEVVAFEREWLTREVKDAAHRAGYPNWWLAEHVSDSVTTYLLRRFSGSVLDVPRLSNAVQSVLQVIGYGEVAPHFSPALPPVHLSLLEIAQQAGPGFELAFFDLLGNRLSDFFRMRSNEFRLYNLERCVRHLSSKKIWSRECDSLRMEIVCFVREQLDNAGLARQVALSIS